MKTLHPPCVSGLDKGHKFCDCKLPDCKYHKNFTKTDAFLYGDPVYESHLKNCVNTDHVSKFTFQDWNENDQ